MFAELLILFGLIILNGIFSMSEIALVSSRKSKLEAEAEEGDKKARAALKIIQAPTEFLSTVQVGITLIGILTGVLGGARLSDNLESWLVQFEVLKDYASGLSLLIVVLAITYFTLVIGELVPKKIGLSNPEKISSYIALPMRVFSRLTAPAVWFLSISTEAFVKLFRIKQKENIITEEEIVAMVKTATDTGELEKAEHDIVERVFFLGDAEVGSLMTPRVDLICLDINDPFEETKRMINESIHTNFPVYENGLDNIIGVLNLKTIVPALLQNEKPDLRSLIQKPLFVPEGMKAFKLLENMKASKTHFAIAVDEHGTVQGAITINDLFKALVGNLYTESEPEIVQRQDGTYLVDGLISLNEFFRFFEIEDTEEIESQGFFTLGGLVLYISNHIPVASEKFVWRNFTFEIIDMDGKRVDKVLVSLNKAE
jgi:putative hemolysin